MQFTAFMTTFLIWKKYPVKFLCGLLQPRDAISSVPPVGFFFLAFFFFNNITLGSGDAYHRLEVGSSSQTFLEHFLWQQMSNGHVWTGQSLGAGAVQGLCHGGALQQFLIQGVFPKGGWTCSDLPWPQLGFPGCSLSTEMSPGAVPAVPPVSWSSFHGQVVVIRWEKQLFL